MITTIDYISFAHSETQKSVPDRLKEFLIRGLSIIRYAFKSPKATNTKLNLIDRFLNNLISKISNNFITINLEFQAIHEKLIKGELIIEKPKEDFEIINKIIKMLTRADNFFTEIDYFGNETLKTELKNSLHTSYLIEVELKALVYKDKKIDRNKDEMFSTSIKSKQSLSEVELAKSQEAAKIYWDKFKKDHPVVYQILSDDKSGEEIVFNSHQ